MARERCGAVSGPMLKKVAGRIGDALWGAPDSADPD
jgi:hypothetical protein